MGGPGADGAVPERLRRRRHARESAPPELLQSPLSYGTTAKATAAAAAAVGEADAVDERDLGSEGIGDLEVGWLEK